MSLFTTIAAKCPACTAVAPYELVYSVNADRRPELRAEILDGTFQRVTCSSCGQAFRIEPQFTYVHLAGHAYITAWPASDVANWGERVARSEESFDRIWGSQAQPMTAQIGRELARRVTFGWGAVHEKLVAADAGIDDVTLELAKLALLRTQDDIPVAEVTLRLIGIDADDNLVIGLAELPDEHIHEQFLVPRALLAEIEADAEAWAPLRTRLTEDPFVDIQRLLLSPATAS